MEEENQGRDMEDNGVGGAELIAAPIFHWEKAREVFKLQGTSLVRHRSSASSSSSPDTIFWRRVVWSPDGTHLLSQSDDHHADLFRLVQNERADEGENFMLELVFSLRAPTTLLAVEWYPFARYDDPASWCFIMGARDVPARLVDAYQGTTRATYGIIDHIERFIGPQAIAFSLDGSSMYFALESEIATFDLANPGTNTHTSFKLTPPKSLIAKGKAAAGQRGLVSCLAVAPDHVAGTTGELLAVGTFSGSVGIYAMERETSAEDALILAWCEEKSAGVSQLAFHPGAPHILFVASRRSNEIRAYDMRYVGSRRSFHHQPEPVSLVAVLLRETSEGQETQQRLWFHLDWPGRYLLAGDSTGSLLIWSIEVPSHRENEDETDPERAAQDDKLFGKLLRKGENAVKQPRFFRQHTANDTIASLATHPHLSLVAVASGARHWTQDEAQGGYAVKDGALRLLLV